MSLMDAPAYDDRQDKLTRNLLIAAGALVFLIIALGIGGYVAGHGWFFSNIPSERKVDKFFTALEARDYNGAYNIYTNGHPDAGYPLARFTEDWTTLSPVKAPITSHHIEISNTEGSGMLGSGVIVATHLNSAATCTFVRVDRGDGTLTWPAIHEITYDKCHNTQ